MDRSPDERHLPAERRYWRIDSPTVWLLMFYVVSGTRGLGEGYWRAEAAGERRRYFVKVAIDVAWATVLFLIGRRWQRQRLDAPSGRGAGG